MAVNVSPRQIDDGRLVPLVLAALRRSGLPGHRLQLEITETSAVTDPDDARRQLMRLSDEGVTVALDDVGTGYSTLRLLRDLPVDVLKIDRSFVRDLPADARAAAIVDSMIGLAHRLGALVCAEGVETAEQLCALRRAGCDDVQGYLLQPPCPPAAVARLPLFLPLGRHRTPSALAAADRPPNDQARPGTEPGAPFRRLAGTSRRGDVPRT